MAPADDLFNLVKGMSKAEKRYFRLQSSISGDPSAKRYMKLFDAISSQKNYDEAALKNKFQFKHFAQDKKHLQDKICESLRRFHENSSADSKISLYIDEFRMLNNRTSILLAQRALNRAKKIAEKFEKFPQLIMIAQYETELLSSHNNPAAFGTQLKHLKQRVPVLASKISERFSADKRYTEFMRWNLEKEFIRSADEKVQLQKSLGNFDNMKGFYAAIRNFYAHGLYYFLCGDFKNSTIYFKKEWEEFQKYPHFISEDKAWYVRCLANNALLSLKANNKKHFKQFLELLGKESIANSQTSEKRDSLVQLLNTMSLVSSRQYLQAVKFISANDLTSKIEGTASAVEKNYLLFNCAEAFLFSGEHKQAASLLHSHLSASGKETKTDAYCIARIVFMLIHFDLGNTDLLEYELKSVHRFLSSRKRIFAFEKLILRMIQTIIKTGEKPSQQEFRQLKKELIDLRKHPYEKNVFEYFDFVRWAEIQIKT